MKFLGYIVVITKHGYVGELTKTPFTNGDENWPKSGLLLDGMYATMFPSNYRAAQAIARTRRYAKATGHTAWPSVEDYRIVPVTSIV